ncbi:MAG: ABC transporter, permease protein 1 (cluster 1, maltose/g3p/polyamine/iron) [uncultured Chloroflexia bacterium]|uniref:ABC transporter, permease protein 1 (Cluster 1, maltose/g3p/polyamine/iron) n=1 Tax=uncultured Chloroflexia bacterium TaxID=1672391 RepID=A0A6J4HLX2_9CHLR|nr:MAG: ABC transporter, permease protein 1 (cluster 1, maltose/g3p/polyamine/iron) [uncultured Chloroflexia bacterium]
MHLRLRQHHRQAIWAYIFLAPVLIFFALFVIYPVLRAFQYSLYRWLLGVPNRQFVGIDNYRRLFTDDPLFLTSIWNTVRFTVGTLVPTIALALGLALIFNRPDLRARGLFRTIYFIPVVSSLVAVGFIWRWLLEPSFGLVNFLLRLVDIKGPGWLASPTWAMPGIMLMSVWRDVGFYMVIFLAGLQTIPRDFQEAAMVDGANAWQRFWKITIPLLNPTLVFATVIGIINGLQLFTQVYVMTASGGTLPGGPLNTTRPIVLHIVEAAFRSQNIGYASAAAFILFIMILVCALIQLRLVERPFEY